MGFRTVIMLNNDATDDWSSDPKLGEKIRRAMNYADRGNSRESEIGNYGRVVECVHADTQTIAILDCYSTFKPLAYSPWRTNDNDHDQAVRMLRQAGEKLGFGLHKKAARRIQRRRTVF